MADIKDNSGIFMIYGITLMINHRGFSHWPMVPCFAVRMSWKVIHPHFAVIFHVSFDVKNKCREKKP
jgi:hypothetical protein